jgi:hypothetical protein
LPHPAAAQILYGSLVGNISDANSAVVPGATITRKVKKLKLLEFTGGCRMSGQFTKVGLNGT